MPVEIQSSDLARGRALLLRGTLDAEAAVVLLKAATPTLRRGVPLIVDLSAVAAVDSAVAGALA